MNDTEQLQHNETPCRQPVAEVVGICRCCGKEIHKHKYEVTHCDCNPDFAIHTDCVVECAGCGDFGCNKCMLKDSESLEFFCDTANTGKVEDSECYQAFTGTNDENEI